jgi:hypothetical protein
MDQKITLTYPDGSKHEFNAGVTGREVAASIGKRLAGDAIAVKLDGTMIDVTRPLSKSGSFAVVTPKNRDGKLDNDALSMARRWMTVSTAISISITKSPSTISRRSKRR